MKEFLKTPELQSVYNLFEYTEWFVQETYPWLVVEGSLFSSILGF